MATMPMGTTLSDLYSSAQRMKLELREGLERLERLESAVFGTAGPSSPVLSADHSLPELTQSLRIRLSELQNVSVQMDRMWRSQIQRSHKDIWKRKVEHIAEEAESLKVAFDKYLNRYSQRQREAMERAELLKGGRETGASILSEVEADQRDLLKVRNSSILLEQTLQTGFAALKKMAEQRQVLKGAQRKALDALNYVGLSDKVLKKVDRQNFINNIITYGGMILTLIIVFYVWKYTKK